MLGGGPALRSSPTARARLDPSRPLARRQNFGLASSASKKSSHACNHNGRPGNDPPKSLLEPPRPKRTASSLVMASDDLVWSVIGTDFCVFPRIHRISGETG